MLFWLIYALRFVADIEQRLEAVDGFRDSRVYANCCAVEGFVDCREALEKITEIIHGLEEWV